MVVKKIFLHQNDKFIGLLMAGLSFLLIAILFILIKVGILAKECSFVQTTGMLVMCSPIIAIILTSIKLNLLKSPQNTFEDWVKKSFVNFLITTITLLIAGVLFTRQKNILYLLLFERFYIILFVPLIGLALSVVATMLFKRGE